MLSDDSNRNLPKVGLLGVSNVCSNDVALMIGQSFQLVKLSKAADNAANDQLKDIKLVLIEPSEQELKDHVGYRGLLSQCKEKSIPVVTIISANCLKYVASALCTGIDDYVLNPLVKAELHRKISSQINEAASRAIFSKDADLGYEHKVPPVKAGERLLLVDDAEENIHALANLLRRFYLVDVVTKGEDAVKLVQRRRYDLVLLDIVIPDLSGFEVCRQIKKNAETENIPVIFFSGSQQSESERKCFTLGAVDYIQKPVSFDNLRSRIERHLETHKTISALYHFSYVDTLTGLANRRAFEGRFEEEYHRAERERQFLSAVMIDIDQFKLYNDHFGHLAGDNCLKTVAEAMADTSKRSGDLICRVGGEEFTALLPNTDIDGAEVYANKLRERVEQLFLEHAPNAVNDFVTVSVGVATCKAGKLKNPYELIFRADQRLYSAKQHGRNRVESVLLPEEFEGLRERSDNKKRASSTQLA